MNKTFSPTTPGEGPENFNFSQHIHIYAEIAAPPVYWAYAFWPTPLAWHLVAQCR